MAVSSLCAHAQMTSTALSPRAPPSAESEGRSRARFGALANGCLMGAVGRVGPAGVTLQFAIARRARLVRDGAGAQPRPPPRAGPAAPWYHFRGYRRHGIVASP